MEEMKTLPIAPELRKLQLGESVVYPIERRGSVMAVISRLRKELIRTPWNVRAVTDPNKFEVRVSRVS